MEGLVDLFIPDAIKQALKFTFLILLSKRILIIIDRIHLSNYNNLKIN